MSIRHMFACFAVAGMVWPVVADTVYSYENDGKTYIAYVPQGETNEISEAAATVLNGNSVTNFVKRGTGTLISNKDITSYVGGIVIAEGVFRSEPSLAANETVGKLDGGGEIWVLDGASMEISPLVNSSKMKGKTIHIAGRGYNGLGVLASCSDTAWGTSSGSKIVLEDDALVCNNAKTTFWFVNSTDEIDFKFHALHVGGASGSVTFYGGATFANMSEGATIVCEGNGGIFTSSGTWNLWHTYPEIVVSNNALLTFNKMHINTFCWPITLHKGAVLKAAATPTEWSLLNGFNQISKSSVVTLLDPVRNKMQLTNKGDHLYINGKVTGGGIEVSTYTAGAGLYLGNRKNDFMNGVLVNSGCSIHMITNGALPSSGAALSLKDGSSAVLHPSEPYMLPPLEASGKCLVTNYMGASATGAWRNYVKKTGSGVLEYSVLVGAPLLDARGGTVKINPVGGELAVFNTIGGTSSGSVDFGGRNYTVESASGSPNVVNCPTLTVSKGWTFDAATPTDSAGFSTDGFLVFDDGCTLTVKNADMIAAGSRRRTWVVATAAGGITGIPECACDVPGWNVEKSADAKTLLLHSPIVGFRMILR